MFAHIRHPVARCTRRSRWCTHPLVYRTCQTTPLSWHPLEPCAYSEHSHVLEHQPSIGSAACHGHRQRVPCADARILAPYVLFICIPRVLSALAHWQALGSAQSICKSRLGFASTTARLRLGHGSAPPRLCTLGGRREHSLVASLLPPRPTAPRPARGSRVSGARPSSTPITASHHDGEVLAPKYG